MSNKAVLLRSVSTLATAAASTVLGAHGAQAQVVPAGTDGYYYSVTGGFALSKSEAFLTGIVDKFGYSGSSYSSYYDPPNSGFSSWSGSGFSFGNGLDDYKGLFASVSFGKQVSSNVDIRGSVSLTTLHSSGYSYAWGSFSSYHQASGSTFSGSSWSGSGFSHGSGGGGAYGDIKAGILAADFEVGYTPTLGNNFNVRLFAGLRALQFQKTFTGVVSGSSWYNSSYNEDVTPGTGFYSSYYSSSSYNYLDGKVQSTFTAIGPRIGVQGSTRFDGTNFGLSGSLATSVLFGKQTIKSSGNVRNYYEWSGGYESSTGSGSGSGSSYFSGASSYQYTANKTVLDLQASIGLDYYLNDSTVLTVGYQGEKLMEVAGDSTGPGTSLDTVTHGAFLKLSGSF